MKNELSNSMNNYLANNTIMYYKLHNLHWNVIGLNFKSVHEYLEELYNGFADIIDEVAEVIKINGDFPLPSLEECLKVSTIKEIESKDYCVEEVIQIVKSDLAILKVQSELLRSVACKKDDYTIVGMLEGHLININKTIWFLDSMKK